MSREFLFFGREDLCGSGGNSQGRRDGVCIERSAVVQGIRIMRHNTNSEWQNGCEWRVWQSLGDSRNTQILACSIWLVGAIGLRHCGQELRVQECCLIDMATFASGSRSLEEFGDGSGLITELLVPDLETTIGLDNTDTQRNNRKLGRCHPE